MSIFKLIFEIFRAIFKTIKKSKKAKQIRTTDIDTLMALDDEDFFDAIEILCEDSIIDINDNDIPIEQKYVYSLLQFISEVNNGGLCQFFVNSSSECAPYISAALDAIGATELKHIFDDFIFTNCIDVNDLSSFKIQDVDEYEEQTERFDFDSFDDKFYEYDPLYSQIISYAKNNIQILLKS